MKKRLISLIIVVLLLTTLCSAFAFADDDEFRFIYDDSDVLTNAQHLELQARSIYERYGIALCFISTDDIDGFDSISAFCAAVNDQILHYPSCMILLANPDEGTYGLYLSEVLEDLYDTDIYKDIRGAYYEEDTYQGGVQAYIDAVKTELLQMGETETEKAPAEESELLILDESQNVPAAVPAGMPLPHVIDEAGVMDRYEVMYYDEQAEALSSQYNCDVVVLFAASLNGKDPMDAADDYFDYNGYGKGENRSGILLLVCPESRDWWISTGGDAIDIFTDSRLDEIEKDVIGTLSKNNWSGATDFFLQDCEKMLEKGIPEPKKPMSALQKLPIALAIGLGSGFVPVGAMKSSLKSVSAKHEASRYVEEGSLRLTGSYDRYITTKTFRRRIESSSNRSGGHVSSSGSYHGGRGGKF